MGMRELLRMIGWKLNNVKSMDTIEQQIFAAELGEAPTVDLHGLTVDLALQRLDTFLHHELMQGTTVIKIIHGHGSGALRSSVQDYLKRMKDNNKLVTHFRDASIPEFMGGVTYAVLERVR